MKAHLQYIRYVLRHKWFVFLAGLKLRVPVHRLIFHDWTKFLPCEWFPYVNYFYGNGRTREQLGDYNMDAAPLAFEYAWNHHQKHNDHHWQHWIRFGDDGTILALPMPDVCRREMLADWIGAGRALGNPDTRLWYMRNWQRIRLNGDDRQWVEEQLEIKQGEPFMVTANLNDEGIRTLREILRTTAGQLP